MAIHSRSTSSLQQHGCSIVSMIPATAISPGASVIVSAMLPGKRTPGTVKAKVLVLNGAEDPFIKPDSVAAFKQEMEAARVDYRYINYPGAVHAFTNPEATEKGKQFNLPLAYHPEADKQSKAEAAKFFSSLFGNK